MPMIATLLAGGWATQPTENNPDALAEYRENNDPLEPINRFLYRVNDSIDGAVLQPTARGYRYAVPGGVRRSIGHALSNVTSPTVFANDVLQGHPRHAAETLTRFVVNSTIGLGGFFDAADGLGLPPHHDGGFGTTLAVWGVGSGPYLFLPLFGPSDARDATGLAGNFALDPFVWASFGGVATLEAARTAGGIVDTRERLLDPVEQLKRDSLDPYATLRSVYRQTRASEIEGARHDG